jgi:hypothetical protein
MLFLLSISVTLVGAAILLAFILFSHSDERAGVEGRRERRETGRSHAGPLAPARPLGQTSVGTACTRDGPDADGPRAAGAPTRGADGVAPGTDARSGASRQAGAAGEHVGGGAQRRGGASGGGQEETTSRQGGVASIPIVRPHTPIPGLGRREHVHFMGKAGFGVLDDERELGEVSIEGDGPRLELEGDIALTSKQIIVFNGETAKKVPFGFMEAYRFVDSFLLIKRRNVKKKKTLLKIFGNVSDFQYILGALIPL